jgi:hypothetical protein
LAIAVSLLIHASVHVSGDTLQLKCFRELFESALASEYANVISTEQHVEATLRYDLKTEQGIPFPALVAGSEANPDLRLMIEWVNVDTDSRGTATIQGGRIVDQSSDPLGQLNALPLFIAANADGTLRLAVLLLAFRADGRVGYAITAERDALFYFRPETRSDIAMLYLAEGNESQWEACWQIDSLHGGAVTLAEWVPVQIDVNQYVGWRRSAEAFVREWLWLEVDAAEATAVERQRSFQMSVPVRPANLRYQKLKSLREHGDKLELSTLAEDEGRIANAVLECLGA